MSEFLLKDNKYINIEVPDAANDPDFRIYHSRLRLLDVGLQNMAAYKGATMVSEEINLPSIMEFALDIEGVMWVGISAYQLSVRKAPIYKWEDIDKKLLELFVGVKAIVDALETPGDLTPPVS